MGIENATKIKNFLDSNHISIITLMGGEFFCHPQWQKVFDIVIPGTKYVRLVSNGDWAGNNNIKKTVIEHLQQFPQIKISLSNDKWHTNRHIEEAANACKTAGINFNVACGEDSNSFAMVPVGRAEFFGGLYSLFGCWCHNPEHKYGFLIDEEGEIFKCGFGVWNYANVSEYTEGGFAERFKKFNQVFYKTWVPNCYRCNMSFHFKGKRKAS